MRRKILSTLLALCMLTAFVPVAARAYYGTQYGDYLYYEVNENGDGITITGCDSNASGEIVIPDEIDNLPVTEIRSAAFDHCRSLTSLKLPNTVVSIGNLAFQWCEKLNNIELPNGLTSIGNEAFSGCIELQSINIPKNVNNIGLSAFIQCYKLAEINVADENEFYSSQNGILFNKDKTKLITYPEGEGIYKPYTVPDGVVEICDEAFYRCGCLTEIILPDTLKIIGNQAFTNCDQIRSINIPQNVEKIGIAPFDVCNYLESIEVAPNNQNYSSKDGVLFDKNKTVLIQYPMDKADTEYTIPDGVAYIDDNAFGSARYLTSVTIPESVTIIEDEAFYGCSKLSDIIISDNVTSIGSNTFISCTALTDVYYSGSETEWKNIDINQHGNDALKNARIHYNYVITDPDTYAISNIQAASGDVELTVISNKPVSGEQIVIAAYYDADGALLDLETQPITYSETEQTVSFNGNENAVSVKAFIWNVLDGMMPASEAAEADIT